MKTFIKIIWYLMLWCFFAIVGGGIGYLIRSVLIR